MISPKKWWQYLLTFIIVGTLAVFALIAIAIAVIYPTLPSLDALTNYRPKQPLRIYSSDGFLIGEYGEEHRSFITVDHVPKVVKDAVIAIEDRRFYEHGGVDYHGIARAIVNNITGAGHEGASTITMQVAKNFFSHGQRNFKTKIYEICLAIKIEKALKKEQILELYLNQIYLGQRSYGFVAASQVYYGKNLDQLTLAEAAMLAGLPKAPGTNNPFTNIKHAIKRQHEVLRDMHRFGFINDVQFNEAMAQKLVFKLSKQPRELSADYVAEIARQMMYDRYKEDVYSSGLNVYTTITKANQEAANEAVYQGITAYDNRHGYRGPEKILDPTLLDDTDAAKKSLNEALDDLDTFSGLIPAVIKKTTPTSIKVYTQKGGTLDISGAGLSFVQHALTTKVLKTGAVVRLMKKNEAWIVTQLPSIESALVALNPETGAITALVGGFDFHKNNFNHATQAWRQPGSSFKPFIYSAALEKNFTAATVVNDAPLSLPAGESGGESWDPHNFDNRYSGPMRLRTALTKSKNMVSIRVLKEITPAYAQDYVTRFGFSAQDIPPYLSMALGAGSTTPWLMAGGYAVFANGGYRVKPYIIEKILDGKGRLIEQAQAPHAGQGAPRAIDERNAFIMTSIMKDVVQVGTAMRAKQLGRHDIAGKTGTTNNQFDTWFAGFSPTQVAVAWMGFDQPRSLGKDETGGKAALPVWIHYMATALKGVPEKAAVIPTGIVVLNISPETGGLVSDGGIREYFYKEKPPTRRAYISNDIEDAPIPADDESQPIDTNSVPDPESGGQQPIDTPQANPELHNAVPQPAEPQKQTPETPNASDSAAKLLNPSGN